MRINHIGYAVKKIDKAIIAFETLGFVFNPIVDDVDRNVKLAFGVNDKYCIELVSPLNSDMDSPVDQYLSNVVGMPYHICYESDRFDSDIKELQLKGYKTIIKPSPAVAFNRKRVVFMFNLFFGLMEIVES